MDNPRPDWLLTTISAGRLLASVAIPALVARWIPSFLLPHEAAAKAVIFVCACVAGAFGFYWFAATVADATNWRRGYRVRWLGDGNSVYEERRSDGTYLQVPLLTEVIGQGYPPPYRVTIGVADGGVSPLLRDRIRECLRGHRGGNVEFGAA